MDDRSQILSKSRNFSLRHHVQTDSGVQKSPFPEVKRPEREAKYALPSNNECMELYLPSPVRLNDVVLKEKDNFTLPLHKNITYNFFFFENGSIDWQEFGLTFKVYQNRIQKQRWISRMPYCNSISMDRYVCRIISWQISFIKQKTPLYLVCFT